MKINVEAEISSHKYELPGKAIIFHGRNDYSITLFRPDALNEVWLVEQDRLFHTINNDVEIELRGNTLIIKPEQKAAKKLKWQESYYLQLYAGQYELPFIRGYLAEIFLSAGCFKCILSTAPLAAIAIEKDNFKWVQDCGFIAGTLVHTDKGLLPIEQLKTGDLVLALCEATGEQRFKKIKQTFRFDKKAVYFMTVSPKLCNDKNQYNSDNLVASAKQLFWTGAEIQGEDHIPALWRSADTMDPGGAQFNLRDGLSASTSDVALIWRTQTEGVGWINFDSYQYRSDTGYLINLTEAEPDYFRNAVAHDFMEWGAHWDGIINDSYGSITRKAVYNNFEEWSDDWDGTPDDCFGTIKCTVYNLEVEQDHSYFVGKSGVLVHDCSANEPTV